MNDLLIKQVGTIVFLVIILWLGSGRLSGWSLDCLFRFHCNPEALQRALRSLLHYSLPRSFPWF